ncbi:1875_t:CDS:1 [Ambispora gerdemannii]|uniref:1875_t:CDS:1 n=1 Tax=Ambispora gerdemannii TaxID=144530 RepID=A0A9N8Z0D6_9GLOM|nr:1875_t:CDS:1 [Ambispora gerdemannii]
MNLHDSDIIQSFKVKAPTTSRENIISIQEEIFYSLTTLSCFPSEQVADDDKFYESVVTEIKGQGRLFRKLLNESYLNSKRSTNLASEIIDYIRRIDSADLQDDNEKSRIFYKLKLSCSRIVEECKQLSNGYEEITKSLAKIYEKLHSAKLKKITEHHRSRVFSKFWIAIIVKMVKAIDHLGESYAPDYSNDPFYKLQLSIIKHAPFSWFLFLPRFRKKPFTPTDLGSPSENSLLIIKQPTSRDLESQSENSFDALLAMKKLQDNLDTIVQLVKDFENYWKTINKQINETPASTHYYSLPNPLVKTLDHYQVNLIIEEWEKLHELFESYAADINKVLDHSL